MSQFIFMLFASNSKTNILKIRLNRLEINQTLAELQSRLNFTLS